MRFLFFTLAVLFFSPLLCADGIDYTVEIQGVKDRALVRKMRSVSQLFQLKRRQASSLSALHFRAEADLPDIKKLLHSLGYFEAQVFFKFEEREREIGVQIVIDLGPLYTLGNYTLRLYTDGKVNLLLNKKLSLKSIGIAANQPALSSKILEAELKALERLALFSYPLAKILKRSGIADGDTKKVDVTLTINTGPYARFGPLLIKGLTTTRRRLIEKKLDWKQGEPYKSLLVTATQDSLVKTGLFTSVLISHEERLNDEGLLPMRVEVTESKHHSLNVGVSYQTFFGPGLTFGWENRNISGMGRKLSIQGDATKRSHSGLATLFLPDFYKRGQNYIWQAQAMHEAITAYSQRTYNLVTRLERQFGRRFSSAAALKLERLLVTGSVNNGAFLLFEVPLYARWSTANSVLNPTRGKTLDVRIVPTLSVDAVRTYYLEQEMRFSSYLPLFDNPNCILAQKVTLGSIISPKLHLVPVPKRFFGGSEDDLRGYKYKTVSPLTKSGKPIGGRSAVFYSLEMRLRLGKWIGLVPFFDVGNVYATQFPAFDGKWAKSLGLGVRYFSFIGPIRLDVGFPLNRRKGVDPRYRILVSIGQAF